MSDPFERLRYHVTGAIERGAGVPIVEVPARYPEHNNDIGDWCPWSGERRKDRDSRCPAGCRRSVVDEDDAQTDEGEE